MYVDGSLEWETDASLHAQGDSGMEGVIGTSGPYSFHGDIAAMRIYHVNLGAEALQHLTARGPWSNWTPLAPAANWRMSTFPEVIDVSGNGFHGVANAIPVNGCGIK